MEFFPDVVNDIYLNDIYYGESVLHIAISNEDSDMVQLLLQSGCNLHQRCFGSFFCPEDQKQHRLSFSDSEFIELSLNTDYVGYAYWGEYPLSFAACCSQERSVQLLLAAGADPNLRDSNGNTVLHILVIHQPNMQWHVARRLFVRLCRCGADLSVRNRAKLTPATLAAKLGRRMMHSLILQLEQHKRWSYGPTHCAAHPLEDLDTIGQDGRINHDCSLMYIAFGSKLEHVEMLEGVVARLLERKWSDYASADSCACS